HFSPLFPLLLIAPAWPPFHSASFPTRRSSDLFQLTINRDDVIRNQVVPAAWQDSITDVMRWTYNRNYVSRAELAIMDILVNNNWERPIYFATTVPSENFMGLDKYLVSEGFALRLMPRSEEH